MRRADQATAAASSRSFSGAPGDFGRQGEAGLREQFPAEDQAGLGVLAGGERRARQGGERELGVHLVEPGGVRPGGEGRRYASASRSLPRRPQVWADRPLPVSSRHALLASA